MILLKLCNFRRLFYILYKIVWGVLRLSIILSWEVHSCIMFERAARGSRFSNMADILTEVMHLYSTGGLTCYWIIRDNKSIIVNYLS